MIRRGKFKLILDLLDEAWAPNLEKDPGETEDISSQDPQ